jgi:hypothetical protein
MAAALRLYGLNWDNGHWLHPDERQVYFVVMKLGWPRSLAEALSPSSALNPHFFAYGSLPFYLLKLVATLLQPLWPALRDPDNLHLAGRPLAALFDLGTVYLTFRLARLLWRKPQRARGKPKGHPSLDLAGGSYGLSIGEAFPALLATVFASLAVLAVQLAHFYTADTLLTFFVMLTLNLAAHVVQDDSRGRRVALGMSLGLALATKISAAPLLFVLFVAFYTRSWNASVQSPISHALTALRTMILPVAMAAVTFTITQPYIAIDWQTFLDHTILESEIARGSFDVPYTLQYAGTLPFLYSMWQTALWGFSLPLGLVAWAGLAVSLIRWLRHGSWNDALLLAWAGPYLVVTGLLYTKYLRYMLPVVPVLCILAADSVTRLAGRPTLKIGNWGLGTRGSSVVSLLLVFATLAYALVFDSMYAQPHSWIAASEWIYRNAPAGDTIAVEHWDTALPLIVEVDGVRSSPTEYHYRFLALYDEPDNASKWEAVATDLAESDLLVIASRRLYGSIPRVPDRYPVTTRYYDLLFAEELGFELVGEFTRGPVWLNPRIPPLPDAAPALFHPDESFVVYDHPRAVILRNTEHLPAGEILSRLEGGDDADLLRH